MVVFFSIFVIVGDQVTNAVVETFYIGEPYTGFLIWWTYHCLTSIISFPVLNTWICWQAHQDFLEFRRGHYHYF